MDPPWERGPNPEPPPSSQPEDGQPPPASPNDGGVDGSSREAKTQVVAGLNYDLTLELTHEGRTEIHQVVVFSQPWTGRWSLESDRIDP